MSTNRTSIDDHEPVSSRGESAQPRVFHSTAPSLGADNRRHPVDSGGFEAVEGFQIPQGAPPPAPRIRGAGELTYKQAAQPAAALGPAPAPANRVVVGDTTKYAWRANAALLITVPGSSDTFLATGWFIGPYAVMTAAHAVYPREAGGYVGWAAQVEVAPGLNGFPNPAPYGKAVSDTFFCPKGWQNHGGHSFDYGVVLLNQPLGQTVGTYGFATYAANDLLTAKANLAGYPVDSPDGADPQGRQWYAGGNLINIDNSFIYYDLSTQSGDSGSCVYRNIGNQSYAMAIHTSSDGGVNRGVRITDSVYANMEQWKSMHG